MSKIARYAAIFMMVAVSAQAADRIVSVKQSSGALTGGQVVNLATLATTIFPAVVTTAIDRFGCDRRTATRIRCGIRELRTGTAAQFFAAKDAASSSVRLLSWDGATATWEKLQVDTSISTAEKSALGTFASGVWPGLVGSQVTNMQCLKDEGNIICTVSELQTKSEADALTAIQNNPGSEITGAVP